MRKRPGPEHIAKILREFQADLDSGLNINQACRKGGIGITTYYRWKALQENPISNEQIHVSELEAENGRLKLLVAELALDSRMLEGGLEKKAMTSARRRLIATELRVDFKVSQRRVARALGLARSNLRYSPVVGDEQAALARRIEVLASSHPRFGYRRIWALLDREGWPINKKTVRRHWRLLGLKLAKPRGKPRPRRAHGQDANACHLRPSPGKDDVWTWDFLFDRTSNGRSLKWLRLIDEYTRECLALEARRGMTAEEIRVILAEVAARRGGPPHRVRSDNGSEFAAEAVRSWLEASGSGALYVAPASPWQNAYAESFPSKLRDEFLDREEFESPTQAQAMGSLWKEEYNTERPHSSLAYRTPAEYAATCKRYVPIDETPIERPPNEHPHP